jgi:hypothetical protein
MKTSIVLSTINTPTVLESYLWNFKKFDIGPEEVSFIIISDNKTPESVEKYIYSIGEEYVIEYWKPKAQEQWIKDTFSSTLDIIEKLLIPQDDMRRRNFGYLRAIEKDSDVTIVIDDDNYPINDIDWLSKHRNSLGFNDRPRIISMNKIINPCGELEFNHENIFSRGYPLDKIHDNKQYFYSWASHAPQKCTVLNMGLWKLKPDVDSYTNIIYPDLNSNGFKYPPGDTIEVDLDNYFPINSQNTSFFTKRIPIFHNIYQDPKMFHRYDDIWMGLFLQKLTHKMGDTTSFGSPLVEHKRNTHDYAKDLKVEFGGISLNSKMWDSIMNMDISSKSYLSGFNEIANKLPKFVDYNVQSYMNNLKESIHLWIDLVEELI